MTFRNLSNPEPQRVRLAYPRPGKFQIVLRDGTRIDISKVEFCDLLRVGAQIASMELAETLPPSK